MFRRIRRLWELSSPPRPRQWTWNGEPVSKEVFDLKMGYTTDQTPNQPARFIPRVIVTPAEKIINEQP